MTKHRSPSAAAFKRQVAEEFIAGETLHALPDGTGWLPEPLRVAETGEAAALPDFLAGEQGEEAVTLGVCKLGFSTAMLAVGKFQLGLGCAPPSAAPISVPSPMG